MLPTLGLRVCYNGGNHPKSSSHGDSRSNSGDVTTVKAMEVLLTNGGGGGAGGGGGGGAAAAANGGDDCRSADIAWLLHDRKA